MNFLPFYQEGENKMRGGDTDNQVLLEPAPPLLALIDDTEFYLMDALQQVQREGWQARIFDHAEAFFSALQKGERFDLVITDRMMPHYDAVRDDFPGRAQSLGNTAPIILNSTATAKEDLKPRGGFAARILKNALFPVAFELLCEQVSGTPASKQEVS